MGETNVNVSTYYILMYIFIWCKCIYMYMVIEYDVLQLFEHAAIEGWKCPPKSISTLLPCSCINN